MKDIRLTIVAAAAVLCVHGGQVQQIVNLAPIGGEAAATPATAGSDTVKVQARGIGLDKDSALKDAYRDAIERAVGFYVDAEQVLENDKLVKDQILTQSNAYITDCRLLSEEKIDGGLVQLRILATVKKQALTTKLTGVMPAQTVVLGNTGLQNVHAQLVTKEKRAEDAAALLKNALEGINPMQSLMVANMRPDTQKVITRENASAVTLRYLFEVKLDRSKYFAEFVPNLKKVLDHISLSKPKEIRLTELMPDPSDYESRNRLSSLQAYYTGKTDINLPDSYANSSGHALFGRFSSFKAFLDPAHVYSILWQGDNWVWQFGDCKYRPKSGGAFSWKPVQFAIRNFDGQYRKEKVLFALITQLKSDCSGGKVMIYELDKSAIAVLNAWHTSLIWRDKSTTHYDSDQQKTTNYNIVFLDKDGEEIGVYPWQIPNGMLLNVKFAEISNAGMVYAAPFVGCFGENLIQWRDFILEKDQITKIASVKIESAD